MINAGLQFAATPEEYAQRQALQQSGMQRVLQQGATVERPHAFSIATHGVPNDFVTGHLPMQQATGQPVQAHWGAVSSANPNWGIFITPTQYNNWDGVAQAVLQRANTPVELPSIKEIMQMVPKTLNRGSRGGGQPPANPPNTPPPDNDKQKSNTGDVIYAQADGYTPVYGGFQRPLLGQVDSVLNDNPDTSILNTQLVYDTATGQYRQILPTDNPKGTLTALPIITPGKNAAQYTIGNEVATGYYTPLDTTATGIVNATGLNAANENTIGGTIPNKVQATQTPTTAPTTIQYPGGTMELRRSPRTKATFTFPLDESGVDMLRGFNSPERQLLYQYAIRQLANDNRGHAILQGLGIDPNGIDTSEDWIHIGGAQLPSIYTPPKSYYNNRAGFGSVEEINDFQRALMALTPQQREYALSQVREIPIYGNRLANALSVPTRY